MLTFLLNQGGMAGEHMGRMMHGGMRGGMFLGGLFSLLWTVLIVLAVLWVVRNWGSIRTSLSNGLSQVAATAQPASPIVTSSQTPLEILQIRYAKGEINREEYQAMRQDLLGEAPAAPAA
jgi:putative membrane protein